MPLALFHSFLYLITVYLTSVIQFDHVTAFTNFSRYFNFSIFGKSGITEILGIATVFYFSFSILSPEVRTRFRLFFSICENKFGRLKTLLIVLACLLPHRLMDNNSGYILFQPGSSETLTLLFLDILRCLASFNTILTFFRVSKQNSAQQAENQLLELNNIVTTNSKSTSLAKLSNFAIMFFIFISSVTQFGILKNIPHVQDEIIQDWQARLLATNQLHPDPNPFKDSFKVTGVDYNESWFYSTFQPGYSIILSLFLKMNLGGFLNVTFGLLSILLLRKIFFNLYGKQFSNIGVILLSLSPFFILMSSGRMNHLMSLFLLITAIFGIMKYFDGIVICGAVISGLAFGLMFMTRRVEGSVGIFLQLFLIPLLKLSQPFSNYSITRTEKLKSNTSSQTFSDLSADPSSGLSSGSSQNQASDFKSSSQSAIAPILPESHPPEPSSQTFHSNFLCRPADENFHSPLESKQYSDRLKRILWVVTSCLAFLLTISVQVCFSRSASGYVLQLAHHGIKVLNEWGTINEGELTRNLMDNLCGFSVYAFGGLISGVFGLVILKPGNKTSAEKIELFLSAYTILLVSSYGFYYYQDFCYGPRFYFNLLPIAVIGTTRFIQFFGTLVNPQNEHPNKLTSLWHFDKTFCFPKSVTSTILLVMGFSIFVTVNLIWSGLSAKFWNVDKSFQNFIETLSLKRPAGIFIQNPSRLRLLLAKELVRRKIPKELIQNISEESFDVLEVIDELKKNPDKSKEITIEILNSFLELASYDDPLNFSINHYEIYRLNPLNPLNSNEKLFLALDQGDIPNDKLVKAFPNLDFFLVSRRKNEFVLTPYFKSGMEHFEGFE
ncbi:MAG: hypothetical protein HQM08_12410 [Candidatus Riflebacteria bacterium]|nr:hypothetical protein [Candidatus Riflebacteria bacterium]